MFDAETQLKTSAGFSVAKDQIFIIEETHQSSLPATNKLFKDTTRANIPSVWNSNNIEAFLVEITVLKGGQPQSGTTCKIPVDIAITIYTS